jgi:hypothetical protein
LFCNINKYNSKTADPINKEKDELANIIKGKASSKVQEDKVSNLDKG